MEGCFECYHRSWYRYFKSVQMQSILTGRQARLMHFTSSRTRTLNTLWVATSKDNILSPDVSILFNIPLVFMLIQNTVASGASATIVSDALMNPFDGKSNSPNEAKVSADGLSSHQAADASTRVPSHIYLAVFENRIPHRGHSCLLRLLSDYDQHDRTVYGSTSVRLWCS